jgi:hypothetical protein
MYDGWAFMVIQVNSITNLLELQYSEIWKYVESILHVYTASDWYQKQKPTFMHSLLNNYSKYKSNFLHRSS